MEEGERGSLGSLRARNRRLVLETLRTRGVVSRAEIARRTGLSRSTVSSLVADLQRSGLVTERDDAEPERGPQGGRPPALLSLDLSAGAVLGIDFGHQHLRVAVSDLSHTVLAEAWQTHDVDHAAADGLDAAARLVDGVLAEAGVERDRVVGVGMGLPGPIDRATGTVGSGAILPGWVGVKAATEMSERLAMPVHVDNDANLGALAEGAFGAGIGCGDLAYLKVSSGIGAGLVLGGRLHHGVSGTAGEIGHMLVDEHGPVCRCGNRGCLETLAAGAGITEPLRRSHGETLTLRGVLALAAEGDPGCRRVIADAGRHIGVAVASLCNLFNPRRVVVGGDLAAAGDLLLDPLRASVDRYAIPAAAQGVEIVPGVLGERAEVLGALALALSEADRFLSRRLAVRPGVTTA